MAWTCYTLQIPCVERVPDAEHGKRSYLPHNWIMDSDVLTVPHMLWDDDEQHDGHLQRSVLRAISWFPHDASGIVLQLGSIPGEHVYYDPKRPWKYCRYSLSPNAGRTVIGHGKLPPAPMPWWKYD